MKVYYNLYEEMTSVDHLFLCWEQFKRGKSKKKDIQSFGRHIEEHIFNLHEDLRSFRYQHGPYERFYVHEPKRRDISKASVRDRFVHQLLYTTLSTLFDPSFIFRSLASRVGKGTHLGVQLLQRAIWKVSRNGTRPCFFLKMDIQRFFDTIDHATLKHLIRKKIKDDAVLHLTDMIIDSFVMHQTPQGATGLPLGNVTSQLFSNIYLHPLDHFVKQTLQQRHYLTLLR